VSATVYATLYRGSVKDLLGPARLEGTEGRDAVVFEYTDSYSVFDWGRMPDSLPGKGEALAILAAHFFEELEKPETWKTLSRAPEAHALRKANRFGAALNECGERLQAQGLRTHYLGALSGEAAGMISPRPLADLTQPVRRLVVEQVNVTRPRVATVLGRQIPDYLETRAAPCPRLVPLEVVFRFSCPAGSSLLERAGADPRYLSERGFGGFEAAPGTRWDFPVLELFTKLESSDRPVTLTEGLALSGVSGEQLQTLLLKTAWVATYLRSRFGALDLELADGKLEWGVDESGELILVDAIGPDELRILKDGTQLSKEFLRTHYRATAWYERVGQAKEQAAREGTADWKRRVTVAPPPLTPALKELASQLYLSLANSLTGRRWFPQGWELPKVVERLGELGAEERA
jgi:phosphoribosylaminoimidazole-succinocarboxamide synthase